MLKVQGAQRFGEIAKQQAHNQREEYHRLPKSTLLPRDISAIRDTAAVTLMRCKRQGLQ